MYDDIAYEHQKSLVESCGWGSSSFLRCSVDFYVATVQSYKRHSKPWFPLNIDWRFMVKHLLFIPRISPRYTKFMTFSPYTMFLIPYNRTTENDSSGGKSGH